MMRSVLRRPSPGRIRAALALVISGALLSQAVARSANTAAAQSSPAIKSSTGFDSNPYPGDDALPALRRHFVFAGYWLNTPPGAKGNSWVGKREVLRRAGFGFLVLWNGRLDAELRKAAQADRSALAGQIGGRGVAVAHSLGERDAQDAVAAARREGFPGDAVLFLDQEEGGRMLPEQAAYLLAWTEAVARSGFRPGVYASGQPVDEGAAPGGGRVTITTAQDIAEHVKAGHLHAVALWVAQDACPPANGCSLTAPAFAASGTPGALVWQYAQSPRRPAITRACAKTYGRDGSCTVPERPDLAVDLDVSESADPSGGR